MSRLRLVALVCISPLLFARPAVVLVAAPKLPVHADNELHKDSDIRALTGSDNPPSAPDGAFGYFDIPCLDVVPAGKSRRRAEVFKELGIDEKHTRDRRHVGIGKVEFLVWQVSPSYDLVCMTAMNDPQNAKLELFDGNRNVYGVRIILRSPKAKK